MKTENDNTNIWNWIDRFKGDKVILIIAMLLLSFSHIANAQRYGPIECEWDASNLVTHKVLWNNDKQKKPQIWKDYPDAVLIREIVSGGWELPAPGGVVYPVYIVYRNEEPSVYDCGELSYNFFAKNPQKVTNAIKAGKKRIEYRHRDFTVVIEYKVEL